MNPSTDGIRPFFLTIASTRDSGEPRRPSVADSNGGADMQVNPKLPAGKAAGSGGALAAKGRLVHKKVSR